MALATYADLTTAITTWVHRSDISTNAADFVTLGESRLNNDLRIRQMETTMSTVIAAGVAAVPTNYVESKHFYISSTTPYYWLERKSAEWIYANYSDRSASDIPGFWARDGSNFIFGAYPASAYTVTMVYYNRLIALSSAVNSVYTSYPGLYLFAALSESAPFLKDDNRVILWEAKYQDLLKKVQKENDREEFSGSILRVTPG